MKLEVPSLFEDQTISWIRIASGVEKYVREAMPVQEDRCKGKTNTETVTDKQMELDSSGTKKMD